MTEPCIVCLIPSFCCMRHRYCFACTACCKLCPAGRLRLRARLQEDVYFYYALVKHSAVPKTFVALVNATARECIEKMSPEG